MGKQETALSFRKLLECLSVVYDEQEQSIDRLRRENDLLQRQLLRKQHVTGVTADTSEATADEQLQLDEKFALSITNGYGEHEYIANHFKVMRARAPRTHDHRGYLRAKEVAEIHNNQPELPEAGDEVLDEVLPAQSCIFCQVASDDLSREIQFEADEQLQSTSTDGFAMCIQPTQTEWPVPPLWAEWESQKDEVLPRVVTRSPMSHIYVVEDATGQQLALDKGRISGSFVVRPNSAKRLVWDMMSSVMVGYDLITIPLMVLTFSDDLLSGGTSGFTNVMDWITRTFWTLDIPWSFLTGYHNDGLVEMRVSKITKNYLQRWFGFDFLVIFIDWVTAYSELSSSSDGIGGETQGANFLGLARIGKTARLARILRAVRLLRFVKLQRALAEALQLINSESIRAGFNILLAVLFIIIINHYIACGWFLVGQASHLSGVNRNWIDQNHIQDETILYAYFTSLHWSLTQFTPAGMEIRPYNIAERMYSIVCLMFALITFSSFLGSITASITQIRNHTTDAGRQKYILRQYFTNNKVSHSLSKSIWNFLVKNHFNHQTRSHKEKIAVLKLLPQSLQGRLHNELYAPYITRAPFFYHYMSVCNDGLTEVCCKATSEVSMTCNEYLFSGGKSAEKMFFVATGYLHYEHPVVTINQTVGTGAWISEAVLWVRWVHIASMRAETSAELVAVDSVAFRTAVLSFKHSFSYVKAYARHFHEYLNNMGDSFQTDLMTDVNGLEERTRNAWHEVCSTRDRSLFRDMPSKEFPRIGRIRHKPRRSFWSRLPLKICHRRGRTLD